MAKTLSNFPTDETSPETAPLKIPRLASLLHRVQHARDADGQPVALLDELLFFLDEPPSGTADRWQAGADLCQEYGIKTSRMAVWRLYREQILSWRREQNPLPAPDPQETARLHEQARHLAAQRLLEMLGRPGLSVAQLVRIVRGDLRRQHLQLARDQFEDRVATRQLREQREHQRRIDDRVRHDMLFLHQAKNLRKAAPPSTTVPPHPAS